MPTDIERCAQITDEEALDAERAGYHSSARLLRQAGRRMREMEVEEAEARNAEPVALDAAVRPLIEGMRMIAKRHCGDSKEPPTTVKGKPYHCGECAWCIAREEIDAFDEKLRWCEMGSHYTAESVTPASLTAAESYCRSCEKVDPEAAWREHQSESWSNEK